MKIKETAMGKKDRLRPIPLYIALICGLFVLLIGLYLSINERILYGKTLPNRYGQWGGEDVYIKGWWLMLIGLILSLYPALQLTKKSRKNKI
ncbi:MAG TPA: hypothetical protein VGC29_00315 [Flavisolibacter sp.]